MSRPSIEYHDLTEAEKRDLIKCIENGKRSLERYRFLLFEDNCGGTSILAMIPWRSFV